MSAIVTAQIVAPPLGRASTLKRARPKWRVLAGPMVVIIMGMLLAALAFTYFLAGARHLWVSGIHDRNAHYLLGLSFALDFRHADLVHFVRDLHAARVWAPLHALLVGMVLAVAGPDYRLAVLPNLAAWVGTAVFAFLIARRAVMQGGNLAGLAAALFVLASPAHRAFATDIMLESLGACLSLAVIYFYLVVSQQHSATSGRAWGLTLTLLFFQKYNYWLLAVLALAAAAVAARPRGSWRAVHRSWAYLASKAWLRRQLRHPLTYVLLPLSALLAYSYLHGGTLQIAGRRVTLDAPYNLVHVAFIVLLVRILPWWFESGRHQLDRLGPPFPQFVVWHVYPICAWFLWPQRLGYFLWYLFRNHGVEQAPEGLASGPAYYWQHLGTDYHLNKTSLFLAAGLAAVALVCWRRLRPGGLAVLTLLIVAGALTFHHPTHRSRFVHSWIAIGWVAAGIGLAQLVYSGFGRWRPAGRLEQDEMPALPRSTALQRLLGAAALAGLVGLQFPGILQASHVPEGGPQPERPSVLAVTDAYLPDLDECRRPAIFANLPIKFLTGWTLLERHGRHVDMVSELRGFGTSPEADRRVFGDWLRSTPCDAVVLVEFPPDSTFYEAVPFPDYRVIRDCMAADPRFAVAVRRELKAYGCAVTVWRRAAPAATTERKRGRLVRIAHGLPVNV